MYQITGLLSEVHVLVKSDNKLFDSWSVLHIVLFLLLFWAFYVFQLSDFKGRTYIFRRGNSVATSEMKSTIKGKNSLPRGRYSFVLE